MYYASQSLDTALGFHIRDLHSFITFVCLLNKSGLQYADRADDTR